MIAADLLRAPHLLVRHQASETPDTTAFFVRSTAEEWVSLQLAAEQYGAPIGQFASDAILTWLDRKIEIPRVLQMPPLTNLPKRIHLERKVVDRIEQSTILDTAGRPIKVSKSDIGMSAILSFVQGVVDMRTGICPRRYPVGCSISDAARPSMTVNIG